MAAHPAPRQVAAVPQGSPQHTSPTWHTGCRAQAKSTPWTRLTCPASQRRALFLITEVPGNIALPSAGSCSRGGSSDFLHICGAALWRKPTLAPTREAMVASTSFSSFREQLG